MRDDNFGLVYLQFCQQYQQYFSIIILAPIFLFHLAFSKVFPIHLALSKVFLSCFKYFQSYSSQVVQQSQSHLDHQDQVFRLSVGDKFNCIIQALR